MASGGTVWQRPRVAWTVAGLAVVAAAVTGWLAWVGQAEAAARSVQVAVVGQPACAPGRDVNDGRRVLVVATPGKFCVVDVEVTNRGSRAVHLDAVVAGSLGTSAAPGVRAVMAVDTGTEVRMEDPAAGPASSPATYDVDVDLGPGESHPVLVGLVLNDRACGDGTIILTPWPSVLVSVGGRQVVLSAVTVLEMELADSVPSAGPECTVSDGD